MASQKSTSKYLNIFLWIAQGVLSLSFLWATYMKFFTPADELAKMWPWTANNFVLVKSTGILDLIAGLGLILPGIFRLQPRLTIYAAYGSIVLMVAASIYHISRGESSLIGINIFFAVLAIFVAWGRTRKFSES